MDAILIVDADAALRQTIRRSLGEGYRFIEVAGAAAAVEQLGDGRAVVLVDISTTSPEALQQIVQAGPGPVKVPVIALVPSAHVKAAVTALKAGACDVLELPVDLPRLNDSVEKALASLAPQDAAAEESLVAMATLASPQLPGESAISFKQGRGMIGDSESLRHVFTLIAKLSKVETSVLIRGESGTGKELVAQALHFNSHRSQGPFVSVNCGAIPDTLIESELFGHEKGAFTGADRKKIGKFEFAQGGTIFLDEIGDISAHMQVKLLRVLQEKKFIPLGSNKEVEANVRVISATNKPLEEMIAKEEFRSDLFYRLNVLPIHLPPLRERKGDIAQLTDFLIDKFNRVHCRDIRGIAADALGALQRYGWPGNVRELENAVEHAFIMESSQQLTVASLPGSVTNPISVPEPEPAAQSEAHPGAAPGAKQKPSKSALAKPLGQKLPQGQKPPQVPTMTKVFAGVGDDLKYPALKEQFEKWFLERALKAHNGRINQTAEGTQMTKVTLLRKLEKYGINPKEYRN